MTNETGFYQEKQKKDSKYEQLKKFKYASMNFRKTKKKILTKGYK